MKSLADSFRSSACLRAIALVLIAISAAGCSADSTRFSEAPYASRAGQGEVTGSIPSGQGAPVGRVEARPLPQTSQLPPPESPARATPVAYTPSAYSPVAYGPTQYNAAPAPEINGSVVAPTSVVRKQTSSGQWTWDGGVAITVAQGETVEGISRRHGVPVAVIMQANNLASPNAIQTGQRLVIPRYVATAAVAPAAPPSTHAPELASVASRPASVVAASAGQYAAGPVNSGVHVVVPGDTLSKIAHRYGKSVAEIAKANSIPPYGKISIGERIVIPGARVGTAKSESEQAAVPAKSAGNEKLVAGAAPATEHASMVTPAADPPPRTEPAPKAAADATPGFRWPVRGRIIAGFGPKPNGQQNDGIDVAVPENTPVKAAEDGEVAYAGNELKGYGNLVLVKHPNGYVTAYANAKELLVKRGDRIKRGDVIAKSGQTGSAEGPQLHFEVRKGTAPIDPMQFLNGA